MAIKALYPRYPRCTAAAVILGDLPPFPAWSETPLEKWIYEKHSFENSGAQ